MPTPTEIEARAALSSWSADGPVPDGCEAVFLIRATHPHLAQHPRVDFVGEPIRAAHTAELAALGYDVQSELRVGVRALEPLAFPRSALVTHPAAVIELLALERELEAIQPTVSAKPGRAESAFGALEARVAAVDPALVPAYFDALVDRYLEVGNAHYANRQVKRAVEAHEALGGVPADWAVARLNAFIDAGFYSSVLVDTALEAVDATHGAGAALEAHLALFDRLLDRQVVPNKGVFAKLTKRARAATALPRVAELALRHVGNAMLLDGRGHTELVKVHAAALKALDAEPADVVVATLTRLTEALLEDGTVPAKATLFELLRARVGKHPALAEPLARLCIRLCKNITFSYSDNRKKIDESLRAAVTDALQALDPAVLEGLLDHWAAELEDYEDWAKLWFLHTYVTVSELKGAHPAVFAHAGIVAALHRRMLAGVRTHQHREEFVEKLCELLEQCPTAPQDGAAWVRVVETSWDEQWDADLETVVTALATHNPAGAQVVFHALAERAVALGAVGHRHLAYLTSKAAWIDADTRGRIGRVLDGADVWRWFTLAALDQGWTLSKLETFMDLTEVKPQVTKRHDFFAVAVHGSERYTATGRGNYDCILHAFHDDALLFRLEAIGRERLNEARWVERDGALQLLVSYQEKYEDTWKVRTHALDGSEVGCVELGKLQRVSFHRKQPWMLAMTKDVVEIRDLDGAVLARHELKCRPGDWDDWYEAVHPLRAHLAVVGEDETLLFDADPAAPVRLDAAADGFVYRGGAPHAVVVVGNGLEVRTLSGEVVEQHAERPGAYVSSYGSGMSARPWRPTNVRGAEDEALVRSEYRWQPLQRFDGTRTGLVDTDYGQERFADTFIADLDGDGIDEVYVFDFLTPRVAVVRDPAAGARAELLAARDQVDAEPGPAPTAGGDVDATIRARAVGGLAAEVFGPARVAVVAACGAAVELSSALADVAIALPQKAASSGPRLSSSELQRLKEAHFSRDIEKYPFTAAMKSGSIEGYRERLVRRHVDIVESAYVRRLLYAHMACARERGLDPGLRGRVLDLAEQLVDLSAEPDVQVAIAPDWAWSSRPELFGWGSDEAKEAASTIRDTGALSAATVARLDAIATELGLPQLTWAQRPCTSIYDYDAYGDGDWEGARIRLLFMLNLQGNAMPDEPWVWGPPDAVAGVRDRLVAMVGHGDDLPMPSSVWPDGAADRGRVDEWMTDAERASMRAEIALLRTLGPDETSIGREALADLLEVARARWGFKRVETAAVLAAMVLIWEPSRDQIAGWSGVAKPKVLGHLKKLIAAGLVRKEGREYLLDVPLCDEQPAFQRLFWNVPPEFYDHRFKGKKLLVYSQRDLLAAYLEHTRGL